MNLKPLNIHWRGNGPQTYYPMGNCDGFSKVTVEAEDLRVNQLPWEYQKEFEFTEPGEYKLEAANKDTFLYEPIVKLDVGKHLYNDYTEILYPLVNPGNTNMSSKPNEIVETYEKIIDIEERKNQDKDALGFKKVRIVMRPDRRLPVFWNQAYKEKKRKTKELTSTEFICAMPFPGHYTDAYGNDGPYYDCNSYYNGFEVTYDIAIPITHINKIKIHEYRKDLIPIMIAGRGEVVIMVSWEWQEWLNKDPEWIIRAIFVGDDEGLTQTINTTGWAVTRLSSWVGLDREIRLAGMGEKTLACTTSSVSKGTSQIFELRIDHDVFSMNLGSPLDPIIPGTIDEMLGLTGE